MALLKYRKEDGTYAPLSVINDSGAVDIAMDSNDMFLVDSNGTKIGKGLPIETIATEGNINGGLVQFVEDDEDGE